MQLLLFFFEKTSEEITNGKVLLKIKQLLIHTNNTLKEIWDNVALKEPTNFIKHFKNNIRKAPLELQ